LLPGLGEESALECSNQIRLLPACLVVQTSSSPKHLVVKVLVAHQAWNRSRFVQLAIDAHFDLLETMDGHPGHNDLWNWQGRRCHFWTRRALLTMAECAWPLSHSSCTAKVHVTMWAGKMLKAFSERVGEELWLEP